jgi:flagellar basal body rod protein FlgG
MDGLEWTASALDAAQNALTVATQNLAGASSDGFHRTMLLSQLTPQGIVLQTKPDTNPGALHRTGRDLDIAAEGSARIRLCDGSTRRAISCERAADGTLHAEDGTRVQGLHGALRLPPQAQIENDGRITENGRVVDRIVTTQASHIISGVVEAANTDSMHAMVDVLEAQRHFETAQKTAQAMDSVAAKDSAETGRAAQ